MAMLLLKNFSRELKTLSKRKADCSKNDFGHVLIIGGDHGMGGAVIMAAEASYRAGAGKVSVLTRSENLLPLLARLPSAMSVDEKKISSEIFVGKTVIVIGCGLGKSAWAKNLLKLVLASDLPKIIDADALNILSLSDKKVHLNNSIITPHVGEAGRLLGLTPSEIQKDRVAAIKKLRQKFGAVAVLKGNKTLVLGDQKITHQCDYGNTGMATAGMGDVLSGVIAGLRAQNLSNETAAILGVNIHALAGDLVAKKQGKVGMVPSDLIAVIPQIINQK